MFSNVFSCGFFHCGVITNFFYRYDDDVPAPLSLGTSDRYYKVAKFPTRNIKTPIVLVYGGSDNLVDINVMLRELPKHTVAKVVPHFEHLDFLWANQVETLVFPYVFDALEEYAGRDHFKNDLVFKSVWNGRVADARRLSNSEDDVSSFTAEEASDLGPNAARNLIKKRDATARKGSSRILRSGIPRNKEHKLLLSSSSTNPTSMSSYGPDEVESPARLNRSGTDSPSNEHRRSGSLSSTKSLDISTRFGERGISVGAGKAIVGGINSPGLHRLSDIDVKDSPKQ